MAVMRNLDAHVSYFGQQRRLPDPRVHVVPTPHRRPNHNALLLGGVESVVDRSICIPLSCSSLLRLLPMLLVFALQVLT